MEYILHIIILIFLYIMLTQSLNLTAGYSGLISLAHAGFYGIGAYTTAILSTNFGLSFLITLPIAIIFTGLVAFVISFIALRTVDDYFIVITLGIQVMIFSLMNNLTEYTNGPLGISGIPNINLLNIIIDSKLSYLILCFAFTSLIFFLLNRITKSPFGCLLISTSEDEIFTQSLGKNVNKIKISSFTLGAIIASIPGVIYAHYISYINSTSFTIDESIFILSIVIIGGLRNLWGSVIAAVVLIVFPELLVLSGISNSITANIHQIFYGLLLVIVVFVNQVIPKTIKS